MASGWEWPIQRTDELSVAEIGFGGITEIRKNSKDDRNGVVRADDLVRAGNPSVVETA